MDEIEIIKSAEGFLLFILLLLLFLYLEKRYKQRHNKAVKLRF
jgi:hypothetical protein